MMKNWRGKNNKAVDLVEFIQEIIEDVLEEKALEKKVSDMNTFYNGEKTKQEIL